MNKTSGRIKKTPLQKHSGITFRICVLNLVITSFFYTSAYADSEFESIFYTKIKMGPHRMFFFIETR